MHVSLHCDYGLRVLMQLALHPQRRLTTSQVANAYGISRHHLTKVVHGLKKAGFITTTRGHTGGIVLARAPEAIGVGQVVRAMEPDMALVECFTEDNHCQITEYCQLRGMLDTALSRFLARLDQQTLADIVVPRRSQLIEILDSPPR